MSSLRMPPRWPIAVLLACAGAALLSLLLGQDANWDLRNYHLYNPWAWRNGRYGLDVAPAQLQTFLNPLLDVPFQAMVEADWPPRVIAVMLALPAGLAAFALVCLAWWSLARLERKTRIVAVAASTIVGVSGVAALSTVGTTMNEWPGAALIVASLALIARDLSGGSLQLRTAAVAGLLCGIACGLKLTAATSTLAMAAAVLLSGPQPRSLRASLVFSVAVVGGLALTGGYWMAFLHERYGSPAFPFYNEIFRSPLLPAEPLLPRAFGPTTFAQWLAFPFVLGDPPLMYVGEVVYRDLRLPITATLALLLLARHVIRRRTRTGASESLAPRFVAIWFASAFACWAIVHSYYRYLLPLELVSGIAIVYAAISLCSARIGRVIAVLLAIAVLATTRYPDQGRVPFGDRSLVIEAPGIEPRSLVLLTADAPLAYLLTAFPTDARHVGIHNNLIDARRPTPLRALVASIIDGHRGAFYQLAPADQPATDVLKSYGLARSAEPCRPVSSNLDRSPAQLCRLERVPSR